MKQIKIHWVNPNDNKNKASIRRMDRAAFPSDDRYPIPGSYWWIAKAGKRSVGYAGLKIVDGGEVGFLCRCGVSEAYRGRGIHGKLLKVREKCAKKMGCKYIVTYTVVGNVGSSNNLIKKGYRLYNPEYEWAGPDVMYFIKDVK